MSVTVVDVAAVVRGRVQGVSFRASLATEARRLGLMGWVRNAADGSVHFVASGPRGSVDALLTWARRGPPLARVDALDTREEAADEGLPFPFTVLGDLHT